MADDFGPYEIVSEIGRGGMGIVYQALDKANQRMVAIKQLLLDNIDPTKRKEFRDRFRREAAMAARLDHPNIVSVFDVEAGAENNYYVMEFLDGHSLRRELEQKGGVMRASDYAPLLNQIAAGLGYAHNLNLVHRDVKPDNIFILKDGQVKITDFGIARMVDYEQTHLTKTGVMLGTLAYVSPEQLQDAKNVDHRADLFSLGVVTYECLSGRPPFNAEGIAQTVIKIISSEAESLHLLSPSVSVETSAVVSKAMRKRARDRFMSVVEFAKAFEKSLQNLSTPTISADMSMHIKAATSQAITPASKHYTPGIPIDSPVKQASPAFIKTPVSTPQATPSSYNRTRAPDSPTSHYLVKPLALIGKHGEGNGCLMDPVAVAARSGKLAVADVVTRKVQLLSYDGRFIAAVKVNDAIKNTRSAGGKLSSPSGVVFDYRGRLYVCDSSDHIIRVYDNQGLFTKELINTHGKDGGIQGITCDSTGLIYVSDVDNGCLQVFQSDLGTWMRKLGSKGQQTGQILLPAGLAVDRQNQVYVVDYGSSRVTVFSKAGLFLRAFGAKGTTNGAFNVPRGVAVDKHDRIYVSDSLNHRVQVFGAAGDWLYSFGGRGSEIGKFVGPAGLSIDQERNCLYVADRGNHRIQVFELLDS